MTLTRRQIALGAAALAGGIVLPSRAAGYPERDILFVNPWSAAGSVDSMARQYTKQIEKLIPGANFTIQSITGGSGTIGVGTTLRAKPDGYTIGYAGGSTIAYQPVVMKGLAWSKPDDMQIICKLGSNPSLLLVKYDSPLRTLDDFMKEVLAKPQRVGVAGLATPSALELQQMNLTAKTQMRIVPFTGGTGESILALLGGRVEAMTSYAESVRGHVEAKSMRVLAVFQKNRYYPFPDAMATGEVAALNQMVVMPGEHFVIAPKGLPKDVLDKLVAASKTVITSDEYKAFAHRGGMEVEYVTPDEIRAQLVVLCNAYEAVIKKVEQLKG
jgi:tripartite-type tricarboxylate transporter receptor subunit TctC